MKTISIKTIILGVVILSSSILKAQTDYTCTVIDVTDGTYYDRAWVFTVPGTTNGFDNGWDGKKFLNTGVSYPQLYVQGTDYTYQIATVPDANNTVLGFIPGDSTNYTFTFTQTALSAQYKSMSLFDKVTNQTIDISTSGSTYRFASGPNDVTERFLLQTTALNSVSNSTVTTPTDSTTTTTPSDSTTTTIPTDSTTIDNGGSDTTQVSDTTTTPVIKGHGNGKTTGNGNGNGKSKKVKVYSTGKTIVADNEYSAQGTLTVINAKTGKIEKQQKINSGSNNININKQGTYIVSTTVDADTSNTMLIIQ